MEDILTTETTNPDVLIEQFLAPAIKKNFPKAKCLIINSTVEYDDNNYDGVINVTCLDSEFNNIQKAEEQAHSILNLIRAKSRQGRHYYADAWGDSVSSTRFIF